MSKKKIFGLCDDPSPKRNPAYIDEKDGGKWIAVVDNEPFYKVVFTAIDNCIELRKGKIKMAKRCDGVLTFNSTISFVELKQRQPKGAEWVKDAEKQLRSTIDYFEMTEDSNDYRIKKAYIANSEHPKLKESQQGRMNKFFDDTGYILRIESRIIL